MHRLSLACAVLSCAVPLVAQNCAGTPPSATILSQDPFGANFYVGSPATPLGFGNCMFVDATLSGPITITEMSTLFYNQGAGNPIVPDQTGLTADINVYTCALSCAGNEVLPPPFPTTNASGAAHPLALSAGPVGAPWTLAGQGTSVITAFPAASIITMVAPIVIGASGPVGICVEFCNPDPSVAANVGQPNAANAGPTNQLITSPGQTVLPSDPFVALTATAFQNDAFNSGAVYGDDINLGIVYDPDPLSGYWEPFGQACYDRPHAFWDEYDPGTTPSIANGGYDLFPSSGVAGPNYVAAPTSGVYVAPNPANSLTATAPVVTTTASWDDATIVRTMPFSIQPPGFAAPVADITISSNGWVMFANNTDPNACFAYYNDIAGVRDFDGRIMPMFGDLDPSAGGLFTYEDQGTQVVITWDAVPEWNTPAATVTMQVTIQSSGIISVVTGAMTLGAAPGIAGYTPGLGAPLGNEMDIGTSLPFQSGDGASAPVLGLDSRPVVAPAAPANLIASNLPANSFIGMILMDLHFIPGGFNLAAVGADDCFQNVGAGPLAAPAFIGFIPVAGAPAAGGTMSLATPSVGASFIGTTVYAQSATLTAGYNNLGVLVSNAVCFRIGT